jgi:hypothetical protein
MSASAIWVYLSASPLLGLTLTLLAYLGRAYVNSAAGHPLANPVLLAVAALVGLLWLTDTPYGTYFDGAQFVISCSDRPPWRWRSRCYAQLRPPEAPGHATAPRRLLVGSLTAALSAVAIGALLGEPARRRCCRWRRSRSRRRSPWASPSASAACRR